MTLLCCALACSDPAVESPVSHPTAADLVDTEAGKADSFSFNPNRLLSDDLFVDADYMTAEEIQAFLEENPYRLRSYLADYSDGGQTFAERVYEAAQKYQINPLILLVKAQVESSLIYREQAPSRFVLDHAMGCGCTDEGPTCDVAPKGLFLQVDCAARLMRSYLTSLEEDQKTVSGWAVGRTRETSDPVAITPANKATAALYTYTPWVLQGRGGNWLFWNVMRKFSRAFLAKRPNHRWIGGACNDDLDCGFSGAVCLFSPAPSTNATGVCTAPCERTCPDSYQPNTQVTFCVDGLAMGTSEAEALCTSVCSPEFETSCLPGFSCQKTGRFQEPETTRYACVLSEERSVAEGTMETSDSHHN